MKLLMENWRRFLKEDKSRKKQLEIMKQDGSKELVDVSYESEHWFIWKMGKARGKTLYSINHKASGMAIPSTYYSGGLKNAKDMIDNVLEKIDIANLGDQEMGIETIKAIHGAITTSDYRNTSYSYPSFRSDERIMINLFSGKQMLLEFVSQQTSDNFKKFAGAVGAMSDSLETDAQESEKFKELYSRFEEAGLEDFLEKIPDIDELLINLESGEGLAELMKSLQDAGVDPEELGEKIQSIQILKDEFEEYKEEQRERQEQSEKDQKNMARKAGEAEVTAETE